MKAATSRARVTLEPRRLWSLRISLGATRWVLCVVALSGVVATVRNTIAPPFQRLTIATAPPTPDIGAQWFALRFARAYLTWSGDLSGHERSLAPFLTAVADPDAGLTPAPGSAQQVHWLAIAAEHDGPAGQQDYTVAADTGDGAVRYLAIAVARGAGGGEVLARYPALVSAPAPDRTGTLDGGALPALTNGAVVAVLDRALRNYLGSSTENLAADLAPGALVDAAAPNLSLHTIQRLAVERSGAVLATVVAGDPGGNAFTLAYQVSVTQLGGRWEITRIEP